MIGRAWMVKVPRNYAFEGESAKLTPYQWQGGSLYNYGLMPPHYPVPALNIGYQLVSLETGMVAVLMEQESPHSWRVIGETLP